MKIPLYDIIHYNKNTVTWFVISIVILIAYALLKDVIVFILTRLYEFFIQQNLFTP